MATQKKNEFRIKFPSGRSAVFGIRNGEVRKISRSRISDVEFSQALNEARKSLLKKTPKPVLSPLQKRMIADAASNELHQKKLLTDF